MNKTKKTKKNQPEVLFEVFVGVDSVLHTDDRSEAAQKVVDLQKKQRDGVITLHDYTAQIVLRYKKEIHEKNWRLRESRVEGLVFKPAVSEPEAVSPDLVVGEPGAVQDVLEDIVTSE
jgi:hypothetical protein